MASKIVVYCNGNYRVPVYPNAKSSEDLGTPEYVGPGNNVSKEYPLHTLSAGEFIFVGAEEGMAKVAEADKAAAEQENQDKTEEA